MSHLHERKEKICLNCRADLIDRYCHQCGQENLEPKETVWHLVQHFFNDVTHFDGKFFSSVKYLMRRPGFLSKEYMNGRRASYLNPIRMYVFSSAIFFLLLFSLKKPEELVNTSTDHKESSSHAVKGASYQELVKEGEEIDQKIAKADEDDRPALEAEKVKIGLELSAIRKKYGDSTDRTFSKRELKTLLANATVDTVLANMYKNDKKDSGVKTAQHPDTTALAAAGDHGYRYHGGNVKDTAAENVVVTVGKDNNPHVAVSRRQNPAPSGHKKGRDTADLDQRFAKKINNKIQEKAKQQSDDDDFNFNAFGISVGRYKNVAQYDSAQAQLPEAERDGWLTRKTTERMIFAQSEFREDSEGYLKHLIEHLAHSIPKILFISLPFFAMILNILYFRRKKTFYYVSHGIFAIHVYCATFILLMGIILLQGVYDMTSIGWLHVIIGLGIAFLALYMLIYLYKAMRGFYGQGRFKTFVKYFLTCCVAFFINTILLIIFILLSAVSI